MGVADTLELCMSNLCQNQEDCGDIQNKMRLYNVFDLMVRRESQQLLQK